MSDTAENIDKRKDEDREPNLPPKKVQKNVSTTKKRNKIQISVKNFFSRKNGMQ